MKDTVKAVIGKGEHAEQKVATRMAIEDWGWRVLDAAPELGILPTALLDMNTQIKFKNSDPDLVYIYIVTVKWSQDNNL